MHSSPLLLSTALLLVGGATPLVAQCVNPSGTQVYLSALYPGIPAADEGLSAPMPLGFAFPIGGSTYTHVSVESNGVLYLTNGGAPVGMGSNGQVWMAGGPGGSPRIAALWMDLEGQSPTWIVRMDSSVPGQVQISWVDVNEYLHPGPFTFQATIHSNGVVDVSLPPYLLVQGYAAGVGIGAGNGLFATASDLSTGPTSTQPILYEEFAPTVDIENRTTTFTPNGNGYTASTTCTGVPIASCTPYGAGCYPVTAGFYELFAAGTFDLAGTGMTMQVVPNGYRVGPAATSFVPPPASATVLPLGDDDEITVPITGAFPYPGGATTALTVCSNGFVSALPGNGVSFQPSLTTFLSRPQPCWSVAWHDFDPTAGGQITFHEAGGIAYVTWDAVFSYGTTVPETVQAQFDTATGAVHVLWMTGTGGGNGYLVGWDSPPPHGNPGGTDLSAMIPTVFAVAGADELPLSLTTLGVPMSTPSAGSAVQFTTDRMPEFAPGVYLGLLIFSGVQVPAPGLDLGFLGAGGCSALLGSLDVTFTLFGATPFQIESVPIPPGVPIGTMLFAQSIAVFPPGNLGNGQNPAGMVTSNGVALFVSVH